MSTETPRMDIHTLIESLPSILGYTPQRSIVVVGLTATRALGGCMRVDMPEPTMTALDFSATVTDSLQGSTATQDWTHVVLVAWSETRNPEQAEVLLLPQVATDVEATGRTVLGRYTVTTASIRGCSSDHPNGHELPREPHRGDDFRQRTGRANKALPASRDEMSEQVAHDGSTMTAPTTPVSTAEHANLWFDSIITGHGDVSTLSAEHVGRLVHGLAHGLARDAAMSTALCTKGDNSVMDEATKATVTAWNSTASLSTLTERMRLLAQRAPDVPVTAHLLGVLAITAYADNNVALATVAIERAGSLDPNNRMAAMIATMIRHGIASPQL